MTPRRQDKRIVERDNLVYQCSFRPRYSGEDSERIWKVVNRSKDRTLYDFACALQDMEHKVLAVVNDYVRQDVHAKFRRKRGAR